MTVSQAAARTDDRAVPRSERTRSAILAAAEALFAERGLAETRLEDVAAAVGIRRASIVYYFADKPALYDAVLADVFDAFRARLEPVLLAERPLGERAIDAVSTWIDYLAAVGDLAQQEPRAAAGETHACVPRADRPRGRAACR